MSAAAVVRHDLDHVAENAERVIDALDGGRARTLAANVSDAADALYFLAGTVGDDLAPQQLSTLTRAARMLGELLATVDPGDPPSPSVVVSLPPRPVVHVHPGVPPAEAMAIARMQAIVQHSYAITRGASA